MKNYYTRKFLMLVAVTMAVVTGAFAQVPELAVYYKFDETSGTVATDASGKGFNGEITDTAATWVDGKYGKALQLSGAGLVSLPANDMGVTSATGSAAFWIKMDDNSKIRAIFSMAAANADGVYTDGMGKEAYDLHMHTEAAGSPWIGGELCLRSQMTYADPATSVHLIADADQVLGTAPESGTSKAIVTDSVWHHAVGTWETGKITLYLDGTMRQSGSYSPARVNVSRIQIGSFGHSSRVFKGAIDEFRFYTYALSSDEVKALYDNPFLSVSKTKQDADLFSAIVNASSVQFRYNTDENVKVNISVYDVTGKKLNSIDRVATAGYNTVEMSSSKFAQGIYIAKVQYSNGKAFSTKFMTK